MNLTGMNCYLLIVLCPIVFHNYHSTLCVRAVDQHVGFLDHYEVKYPLHTSVPPLMEHQLEWQNVENIRVVGDDRLAQSPSFFADIDHDVSASRPIRDDSRDSWRRRQQMLDRLEDIDTYECIQLGTSLLPALWNAISSVPYIPINGLVQKRFISSKAVSLETQIMETRQRLLEAMFR